MPARARAAGAGALAGFGLLVVSWFAAFHVSVIEQADRSLYGSFGELGTRPRINSFANHLAGLCDPKPYVVLCVLPLVVAVVRRRPWLAVAIGLVLLGANATTQLLKPLFAHAHTASVHGLAPTSSWPSGHATAAMSLALCCVLAAPSRVRPFAAAAGAVFAVAVAYSVVALGYHYPSDVVGGFLVAGIWSLAGAAAVLVVDARGSRPDARPARPRPSIRRALGPSFAAVFIAAALVSAIALTRPRAVLSYLQLHEGFAIGAPTIGLVGLMVSTYVLLALRR